ncbi:MAG: transglutaminase domain-containing protein [Sedimentisphaerales bacterium]|nr:transglutaminase domain-containing protein [Sedimentisphaerales bacterium]
MPKPRSAARAVIAFAAFSLMGPAAIRAEPISLSLPVGWQLLRQVDVPEARRDVLGRQFQARIEKITNTYFSAYGRPFQVNIITTGDSSEAERICKAVQGMKGNPIFCLSSENNVVEFVCDDPALAIMGGFELGMRPKPTSARYKVRLVMAPVEQADYSNWNKLTDTFIRAHRNPTNLAYGGKIKMLCKKFGFGSEVILRSVSGHGGPEYSFNPPAVETTVLENKEMTRYRFENLTRNFDVPAVALTATISTTQEANAPTNRTSGADLLAATEYWPSDDNDVVSLAREITADANTPKQKVSAILQWLLPNTNIRFTDSSSTARYGVKKVLSQKYGQSWDFADCFVTLCRASGIPAREVAGWFYAQSAHFWAEVLLEDRGWQQVDPTGGGIVKCGIYHIPLVTTEDGSMPLVYLSEPAIEFLGN